MADKLGTRTRQGLQYERNESGSETRTHSRDVGMTKYVVASITFGSGAATGASGTFTPPSFAVNDPLLVGGALLNNGFFTVTGLDAINAAYLTLDPPPKAEGPLTVTLRTP